MAGWIWAITAPLISLITYTVFFSGAVKLPNNSESTSAIDYGLFVFGGLVAFNFFTEMAYRAPSLLHEYSHYIKQTMFPAEMLPIISTLRAMTFVGTCTAFATCHTIRRAIGLIAGPLKPPMMLPNVSVSRKIRSKNFAPSPTCCIHPCWKRWD